MFNVIFVFILNDMIYETGRGELLEGGIFVCIDCCLYAVLVYAVTSFCHFSATVHFIRYF